MSRSQERREAVQREADAIARLRAMVERGRAGLDAWKLRVAHGVAHTDHDRAAAVLVDLAPELLAVVEAGERWQRASVGYACGEIDVIEYGAAGAALVDALDALRARAAEVTR